MANLTKEQFDILVISAEIAGTAMAINSKKRFPYQDTILQELLLSTPQDAPFKRYQEKIYLSWYRGYDIQSSKMAFEAIGS